MEQPSGTGHAEENKRQNKSCNISGAYGGDTGNFIGNKFGLTSTETGQIIWQALENCESDIEWNEFWRQDVQERKRAAAEERAMAPPQKDGRQQRTASG